MSTPLPPTPDRLPAEDDAARRSTWRWRPTKLVIGALTLGLALSGGAAGYVVLVDHNLNSNLARADTLPAEVPANPAEAPRPAKASKDALNYLVIGTDGDTGSASRGQSDLLMVLHLSGDRRSGAMISLPADLRVDIPGQGKHRLNTASTYGGPKLAVRTVEGLLGVRMDHVLQVDFAGFMKLTQDLGGVTVQNEESSTSDGYNFPKGSITLDSDQALAYVRQRDLPGNDLARTTNQRLVMEGILRKTLSKGTIANPAKFNRIVESVAKEVVVDRELTASELRGELLSVRFKPSELRSIQLPVARYSATNGPRGTATVDKKKLKTLTKALNDDDVEGYPNG